MNTIDSDDTDRGWKTEKLENVDHIGTSDVAQSSGTDLTADDEPRHRLVI